MAQPPPTECLAKSFSGRNTLLQSLELIGRTQLTNAVPGGREQHTHPGLLEVCYLVRGTAEWSAGGQTYQLKRDDLFVTQPGEVHGGVDGTMHRCELYWLHIKLPLGRSKEDQLLSERIQSLQVRQCPGTVTTLNAIERLFQEHCTQRPFSTLLAGCLLNELLIRVLRDFNAVTSNRIEERDWSIATQKAMACIQSDLAAQHTIKALADAAHVSERHLAQRFDAEVGMTPTEFVTHARVEQAKTLLTDTSQSVTQIAFLLGFSSSQYFATIFRSRTGVSPLAYRKHRFHDPT